MSPEYSRRSISLEQFQDQVMLRMKLMYCEGQLQNFTPLRDQLLAAGQDANARYREIQARSDELSVELRKFLPDRAPRNNNKLPPFPLIEARLHPPIPGPSSGYGGYIQVGSANEGRVWGSPGARGTIETLAIGNTGKTFFTGDIAGHPVEGYPTNPGNYEKDEPQVFISYWDYIIPFPMATSDSMLTYSFDVTVQEYFSLCFGPAIHSCHFVVSETANYTGERWPITAKASGWPISGVQLGIRDFFVRGRVPIQQSMVVRAGQTPALYLLVGVGAVLASGAECIFDDDFSCFFFPGVDRNSVVAETNALARATVTTDFHAPGFIKFQYDPIPIVHE